jgi:hypothetical protein
MKMVRYIIYTLLVFAIGCMPKIEDDPGIDQLVVTNHSVNKISSSDSDIIMEGTYPGSVTKIYIAVDNDTFAEAKNASLARNLGVASVIYNNGRFTITYPLPNPYVSRNIVFKIRGGNSEGRQGEITIYEMTYAKPPSAMPGFAIVSTGGLVSMGPNFVLTSVGQSVSPYRAPASANGVEVGSPSVMVRYGVIGVLLEE